MKKADIKVGEEYAVSTWRDYLGRPVNRVRVVGVPFQTNYSNETSVPFVYVTEDGSDAPLRPGVEFLSRPTRDFKMTWTDYLGAKAVRDAEVAERHAKINAARRAQGGAFEEIEDVLFRAGVVDRDSYQWRALANGTGSLTLSPMQLARVIACAREAASA